MQAYVSDDNIATLCWIQQPPTRTKLTQSVQDAAARQPSQDKRFSQEFFDRGLCCFILV